MRSVLAVIVAVMASSSILLAGNATVAASNAAAPASVRAAASPTVVPDTTPGDWGRYTHDDRGSGFASSESQISVANASSMAVKWSFTAPDLIFSQATVANGMVFFNDNSAREHALNLNGTVVWTQPGLGETFGPAPLGPGAYTQGPVSTAEFATITNGTLNGATHVLYVAGGLGDVFALNADTGAILWKTNITNPAQGGFTWSSPLIANNNLYMGIASEADQPLNPGAFVKMDALTGGSVVTATIPPPPPAGIPPHTHNSYEPDSGPCVGGGIFGSPSYDASFGNGGTIYVATGTLDPECATNNGAGSLVNPDKEESVIAFDPATLTIRDFWHLPFDPTQPDLDFGSVPTLFDAPVPSTSGHMLGVVNKNGLFYALDRQNLAAGPLWTTRIEVGGGNPESGAGAIAPAAYDGNRLYEAGGFLTMTVNAAPVTCATVVTAMDPTSGAPDWQRCFSGPNDGEVIGPVTVANGVVIVGEGIYIKGLSAADGSDLFSFVPSGGKVHTGPTVANGVVYVGDSGKREVALQLSNPTPAADRSITQSVPAKASVSGPMTFTLTAANAGPSVATGVKVQDTLPAGASFVSASTTQGNCTNAGSQVTCNLVTPLPTTATATITINVTAPATPGTVNNTATITGNEADPNSGNNSASAAINVTTNQSPPGADVSITKSGPSLVVLATPFDYTLTVSNAGPLPATNVVARDSLPAGVSFLSATQNQGFCSQAGGTVSCGLGALGVLGSAVVKIHVVPNALGTVTNVATVRANEPDPNTSNNTSVPVSTRVGLSPGPVGTGDSGAGYWLAASDGGIFNFGPFGFYGSAGSVHLNKPIVGMAATPTGKGYWLVASDGGIFNYGDAGFLGSTGGIHLNQPIVGMAATPSGQGYWLVASDGGIFTYGDAAFLGSTGGIHLNRPIVGMAATPSGKGYWLVASDGGIFNYGDAWFLGSTGNIRLNKPIVGMSATPSGNGYWLVASDGGIFNFGDGLFLGSTGGIHLNQPIVGMVGTATGNGYWLVATDGGIFNYGDATFQGSTGAIHLNRPIVGMA